MEHILYYKFDKKVPEHVVNGLTEAARATYELDQKMLKLRGEILSLSEEQDAEETPEKPSEESSMKTLSLPADHATTTTNLLSFCV